MANRVPIIVRLETFEGPLDLLLYLIQSHELDISRVSIQRITDQYLIYVRLIQELNFDAASEFLVMAATLLHWKSRALLPPDEKNDSSSDGITDDILTQEELVKQLLEHQRFLAAGENLAQLPQLGRDVFCRANSKPPIQKVWREMSLSDLALSYQDMLIRSRKRTQVLKKETVSINDKIMDFVDRLPIHKITPFHELLSFTPTRAEIVATFLASLELGRLRKMKLYQEGVYQEIFLELLESLIDFDLKQASGFESFTQKIEDHLAATPG